MDILSAIIGGAIGFVSSIGIIIIERILDRKGKLNVFYKCINSPAMIKGWGIHITDDNRISFLVPVAFELQNTSNTTRVIRDLSLELYNENSFVAKMIQSEYLKNAKIKDGVELEKEVINYGSEKGSYSFVLPPRSIQKQKCSYVLAISQSETKNKKFDSIRISYFDERNHKKSYLFKSNLDGWDSKSYQPDKDWQIVK